MMTITPGGVSMFLYEVNHLVDAGLSETIENVHAKMREKEIVEYLAVKYEEDIDLSLFIGKQWSKDLSELLYDFSISHGGNESRKWGIENNGLCLLVSWSAELIRDWEHYVE